MTKRFLNVQYGTLTAEVEITGISRLGEVQDAIKAKLSNSLAQVYAPLIQLYTNSNKDQLITDLDDITPENTPLYYQKLTQGGSCVVIGTSPREVLAQSTTRQTQGKLAYSVAEPIDCSQPRKRILSSSTAGLLNESSTSPPRYLTSSVYRPLNLSEICGVSTNVLIV
jgi:hypothetical protein